jgi:paraquat-inducible protein B
MAKKSNPALIGAFVLGAIALAVVAIVLWGSESLFERKYECVCYFPGSVAGLTKGATVKYRGVEIGVVKEVRVRFRQPIEERRIPALIEIWGKRLHELGAREPTPALLDELVGQGLRARLASTSLVTGVMYVNLDFWPDTPLHYAEIGGPGALPEIPTLPTELDELSQALHNLVANLSTADIKGLTDSVAQAMRGVGEVATSEDLRSAIKELPPLFSDAHHLTKSLQTDADKAGAVVNDAQVALGTLVETLESTRGTISPEAPLASNLTVAVSDVDKAAISVRELADFLRRNPHAIVAGTKPRPAGP